ncbi:unnamed protein product [Ceutorhynchus assimilis]|uniref:MD-2-related lipid-recognition domain-containing protein n=1 Tax=Ceutorhynchus assimilis TaxID=467358 RepID=A0A9N9QN38_9CUCU|nr:unnamed protein product [Ceutorhynchus assimilis]
MSFAVNIVSFIGILSVPTLAITQMNTCSNTTGIYPNVTYSVNSYVCDRSPCLCVPGCTSSLSVDFQAPKYLEKMRPKVHATCLNVQLDYPLNQDDVCVGFTNTQCPIVEKEKVNYKYNLNIGTIFPEVTVTLRFSFIDEDTAPNTEVLCFEFDIIIKKTECPA